MTKTKTTTPHVRIIWVGVAFLEALFFLKKGHGKQLITNFSIYDGDPSWTVLENYSMEQINDNTNNIPSVTGQFPTCRAENPAGIPRSIFG